MLLEFTPALALPFADSPLLVALPLADVLMPLPDWPLLLAPEALMAQASRSAVLPEELLLLVEPLSQSVDCCLVEFLPDIELLPD